MEYMVTLYILVLAIVKRGHYDSLLNVSCKKALWLCAEATNVC